MPKSNVVYPNLSAISKSILDILVLPSRKTCLTLKLVEKIKLVKITHLYAVSLPLISSSGSASAKPAVWAFFKAVSKDIFCSLI